MIGRNEHTENVALYGKKSITTNYSEVNFYAGVHDGCKICEMGDSLMKSHEVASV